MSLKLKTGRERMNVVRQTVEKITRLSRVIEAGDDDYDAEFEAFRLHMEDLFAKEGIKSFRVLNHNYSVELVFGNGTRLLLTPPPPVDEERIMTQVTGDPKWLAMKKSPAGFLREHLRKLEKSLE